ncbi:hypothetical protein V6N13_091106 [Hibiscus sabdariffa]
MYQPMERMHLHFVLINNALGIGYTKALSVIKRFLADGLPSGRPPDPLPAADTRQLLTGQDIQPVQQIHSGDSLERPGSPISLDLQRQCKKVRGDDMQDPIEVSDVMETDGEQRGLDIESGKEENRVSYATVLTNSGRGTFEDQNGLGDSECDPHKILVSDEDCESCDGTEGRDRDPQDGKVTSDTGKEIREGANAENLLFGPWMTVDTRRKRDEQVVTTEEQGPEDTIEAEVLTPCSIQSREVPVRVNGLSDQGVTTKAAASVTEVSDNSRAFEKAVILPMVEEEHVTVVARTPACRDKGHVAISLLEKGHGRTVAEGVVLGKGRGGKKR